MLSVYGYQKPDEFLRDSWNDKKRKNSQFTIRAWANQMDIKHHNTLHDMVKGKRKIPKATIPLFIKHLNLNVNEGLYFELMVDLSKAKSEDEKKMYFERMKTIAPKKNLKAKEIDSFWLLRDPMHFFINELAQQKNFRADPEWICSRLIKSISRENVAEILQRLIDLDLLRLDVDGKVCRVNSYVRSKTDINDRALKEYHKNLMEHAKEAIESQDVMEREFRGLALNLNTELLPEAKEVIRDFVTQFSTRFDTPKAPNEQVYQLNIQFFAVTQNSKVRHV
jgi:uncharacterized protein (TIGR02147 family)